MEHQPTDEGETWWTFKTSGGVGPNELSAIKEVIKKTTGEDTLRELRCVPYVTLAEEDAVKPRRCITADERNKRIQRNNSLLIDVINKNVLQPLQHKALVSRPPPDNYEVSMHERWIKRTKEPLFRLEKAVEYLAKNANMMPHRDYAPVTKAPDLADEHAFSAEVERRAKAAARTPIPMRCGGQRAESWDGRSERDSANRPVRWSKTSNFSFLYPDIKPEIY